MAQISNAAQTHEITIDENGFHNVPNEVFIGDTIRWTNKGVKNHQVQATSGTYLSSGLLSPGVSYEYTFESKIPQIRIYPATVISYVDQEMPTHELSFRLRNEPVLISPKTSFFKKTNPFNILIFLGVSVNVGIGLPPLPSPPLKQIELTLDGVQVFNGSLDEFRMLNFVDSESFYSSNVYATREFYSVFSIVVNPNILSPGVHNINVKITRFDSLIYEDSATYTIF